MTTKEKFYNPFYDEVRDWVSPPGQNSSLMRPPKNQFLHERSKLRAEYAYGIPSEKAILTLVTEGPLVEIGAGSGYWAHVVEEHGGSVEAFDNFQSQFTVGEWFDVHEGTPEDAGRYPDRTLFLCWPPYSEDMAARALEAYEGNTVCYVGEGKGGCTADMDFHERIEHNWNLRRRVSLPQFMGIHDNLHVYDKKNV